MKLHLAAKRYLCATEGDYRAQLSPASVEGLALQGGPMSTGEVSAFRSNPFLDDALRPRRWDDRAKIEGLNVPGQRKYRDLLAAVARP